MRKITAVPLLVSLLLLAACAAPVAPAVPEASPPPATPAQTAPPPAAAPFADPWESRAAYDALLSAAAACGDEPGRAALLAQAQELLLGTRTVLPLCRAQRLCLRHGEMTGLYTDAGGALRFLSARGEEDTLRVQLGGAPLTLDPALCESFVERTLSANCFTGLYEPDADGELHPACAQSLRVSPDGLSVTVTLREGLLWSNGHALTAADFVWSWQRAAGLEAAPERALLSALAGYPDALALSAPDERTIEFTLAAPCGQPEALLAHSIFRPVHRATVNRLGGAGFVCNGAYRCTQWTPSVSLTLQKNEKGLYAAADAPRLVVSLSADAAAVQADFDAGALALAYTIAPEELARRRDAGDPALWVQTYPGAYVLAFDAASPLFARESPEQAVALREGISLLIDREYLAGNIPGAGAACAALLPETAEGAADLYAAAGYAAALDAARQRLAATGLRFDADGTLSAETPLTLRCAVPEGRVPGDMADYIRLDLATLGVELCLVAETDAQAADCRLALCAGDAGTMLARWRAGEGADARLGA